MIAFFLDFQVARLLAGILQLILGALGSLLMFLAMLYVLGWEFGRQWRL